MTWSRVTAQWHNLLYGLVTATMLSVPTVPGQAPNAILTCQPLAGNLFRLHRLGDASAPSAFDLGGEDSLWQVSFRDTSGSETQFMPSTPGLVFSSVQVVQITAYDTYVLWLNSQSL